MFFLPHLSALVSFSSRWDAKDADRVYVRDSGSATRDYYSLKDDIVGWRLYNIAGPRSPIPPKTASYEELDQNEVAVQREVNVEELAAMLGL